MNHQIKNDQISVEISSIGAELQSIKKDGTEYMWEGDSQYWAEKSPLLFPFVGRFTDGSYYLNGVKHSMGIHGFARFQDFDVVEKAEDRIVFEITDTAETYVSYPYHFTLKVFYELEESTIKIGYLVNNLSENVMYFGIGGHPGFRVPLEEGLSFADYYLEFSGASRPDRVGFTPACFLNGINEEMPLKDGNKIPMAHNMFDDDAIVLQNMAREVCLKSDKGTKMVKVSYPQCSYLGFWHAPKTEAPYICIEPWTSLPSRQDVIEEFANRSDLIRLVPDGEYTNNWSITII